MAGLYDHIEVTWQAFIGWQLSNPEVTHVRLLANGVMTCGPIHGCHMSLIVWFMVVCKNYWESAGFDPWTSPTM
jgi:hypothetical protein